MTSYFLVGIGGSETYLLTVAEQLQRLGHEVTVHAAEGGAMSEHMRSRGLRVAIGEGGLPASCDALLVQDAAMAYALAERAARELATTGGYDSVQDEAAYDRLNSLVS